MANNVRVLRWCALITLLSICGLAHAQMIEMRTEGGKTITCMRTGLTSDMRHCGPPDWYAYVFVGSISSIRQVEQNENELLVTTEEIFKGEPAAQVTVRTSQAACFPAMHVGDRWLFYFRSGSPSLLDYYGNDSVPVQSAVQKIEILRRVKALDSEALLMGSVRSGLFGNDAPVPQAQIVLERFPDKLRFFATTDDHGQYEFQPLPPGRYGITVSPVNGFQPDGRSVNLEAGDCWDMTLRRSPHARISGHVRNREGKPAPGVPILFTGRGKRVSRRPEPIATAGSHSTALSRAAFSWASASPPIHLGKTRCAAESAIPRTPQCTTPAY